MPKGNGPTESVVRASRVLWSRDCERGEDEGSRCVVYFLDFNLKVKDAQACGRLTRHSGRLRRNGARVYMTSTNPHLAIVPNIILYILQIAISLGAKRYLYDCNVELCPSDSTRLATDFFS